jgi:hypothetical protein
MLIVWLLSRKLSTLNPHECIASLHHCIRHPSPYHPYSIGSARRQDYSHTQDYSQGRRRSTIIVRGTAGSSDSHEEASLTHSSASKPSTLLSTRLMVPSSDNTGTNGCMSVSTSTAVSVSVFESVHSSIPLTISRGKKPAEAA